MGYEVVKTESAYADLVRIVTHIFKSLSKPQAATVFLDIVEYTYGYLESNPEMYEQCRDPQLKKLDYRKAVIHRYYIMICRVEESEKQVYILRFFYGKQDHEHLL